MDHSPPRPLSKLCNVVALRDSVRHLRGLSYQADRRAELLQCAWPDHRTPTQEQAITAAILHAQSVRAALAHQQQILEMVVGEPDA
jgi:acyl-CoA hydrolase